MAYNPLNPNGQATTANSQPVTLASNQPDINVDIAGTVFTFSPTSGGNSTTSQLASGASFTGTIESVVNQQSYSILFFSDQNATITIKQYIDLAGTKLINSIAYTYTAGATNFARSGVANGNYFQIVVQNTGGSTTTTLQLDTAYGTIPSSTPLGNSPSAINEVNGTTLNIGQQSSSASLPVTLSTENISDLYVTGQSAQTATVNNILTTTSGTSATDVLQYRSFNVQIVSTGTAGTFIFEGSNDNINFQSIPVYNVALVVRVPIITAITATSSQIVYEGSCNFRYLRLRIATTITGGSIQAFSTFCQVGLGTVSQVVSNGTAGNLLATVSGTGLGVVGASAQSAAVSGNPVYMAGKVTPTTIATVDATLIAGDTNGLPTTTGNQVITKDFGTAELDYTVNFSSITTTTTVQQLVPTSGTASVRNYIPSLNLHTDAIGTAGVFWVLDSIVAVTSIAITTGLATTGTHDLKVGDAVVFTALASGTGVSTNTVYYVTSVGSATTFNFSATVGGANVVPSVAYTGTSMYRVLYQQKLQTTGIATPVTINFPTPLKGIANTQCNLLFPTSLTSGTVYLTVNGYRGF